MIRPCFIPPRKPSVPGLSDLPVKAPPKAPRKARRRRDPNEPPRKRNRLPKPPRPKPHVKCIHDPNAVNQPYGYSDDEASIEKGPMPTSVVGQAEHLNESVGSQQNSVATTGPLSKEKKVDSNDSAKRAEDKNLLHRGSRVAGKKKHKKEREQKPIKKGSTNNNAIILDDSSDERSVIKDPSIDTTLLIRGYNTRSNKNRELTDEEKEELLTYPFKVDGEQLQRITSDLKELGGDRLGVDEVEGDGENNHVETGKHHTVIRKCDKALLEPGVWVNGGIINFWMLW
jgi:hypothetical protein